MQRDYKNNHEANEIRKFIENEKKVYQSWADRNNHHTKRLNPDKLARISKDHFPTKKMPHLEDTQYL